MKIKAVLVSSTLLASLFIADAALASPGYVSRNVRLRAGPDGRYPVVERLRAGTRVEIFGCLDGWNWCEVATREDHGWVSGSDLQALQHRRRVYVSQAGPSIQIPVIRFEVGSYWDEHYHDKPFYHDRDKWTHDRDRKHSSNRDDRNDRTPPPENDRRDDHQDSRRDDQTRHESPDYGNNYDGRNDRH